MEQKLIPRSSFDFEEPAEYSELLPVLVRSTSTIEVRQVVYSVPPSLIGRQVTVRLHHDRLIVYLGSDWVYQLPRDYGRGGHGPQAWCSCCRRPRPATNCRR